MKELRFNIIYVLYLVLLVQIERKLRISSEALNFLRDNDVDLKDFDTSTKLQSILEKNKNPAVILLNKYALNITINFLCNIKLFKKNSHSNRILIFAFDEYSSRVLSSSFNHDDDNLDVIYWPINGLKDRFKASDGRYQLFQLFRARLCEYLSSRVDSFWMIQADTIWRTDLFTHFGPESLKKNDILFDSEGDKGLLKNMIAGGYFHVNSNQKTTHFFENIGEILLNYYVTDNNLMGKQCLEKNFGIECGSLPYKDLVNWRWNKPEIITTSTQLPLFLQFDGGESTESKFQLMNKLGVAFVDLTTLPSSESHSGDENQVICLEKLLTDGILDEKRFILEKKNVEKSNIPIKFFHNLFEVVNDNIPYLDHFIITKLFPYYAYYLVI